MKFINITLSSLAIFMMAMTAPSFADEAQIKKGKKIFKKCKVCHSIKENGKAKIGPNLYGIIGKKIASNPDFKYSKAMLAADFIWTEEKLKTYLEKPRKMFKKTKMIFPGLKKQKHRDNLIAYIKSTVE